MGIDGSLAGAGDFNVKMAFPFKLGLMDSHLNIGAFYRVLFFADAARCQWTETELRSWRRWRSSRAEQQSKGRIRTPAASGTPRTL